MRRHLILKAAAVLNTELEDASAFERRPGTEIIGIHDQTHVLDRQSEDLILAGLRVGEPDQLENRTDRRVWSKALAVGPRMRQKVVRELPDLAVVV